VSNDNALSASLEDYLEAITRIADAGEVVRTKCIAKDLGIRNASVTGALHSLSKKGFINYEPYGSISLTSKGLRTGRELLRSHHALRDFLMTVLGVESARADTVACSMEHVMPPDVMRRFVRFAQAQKACPANRAHCSQSGAAIPQAQELDA